MVVLQHYKKSFILTGIFSLDENRSNRLHRADQACTVVRGDYVYFLRIVFTLKTLIVI